MPIHVIHPDTGDTITASLVGTSIVISPCFGESYSFDCAGRLLGLFVDGQSYQRTLDNRLLQRNKHRDELSPEQRDHLLKQVFCALSDLAAVVPRLALDPAERDRLADALERVRTFGPERLAADGANFETLYKPVSILPPDQYLALVLQATEGCSWNRCTFCGLYRDRAFRIHSPESFRVHCEQVRDFYGEGISLRRGIFLADANALVIPMARLVALLEIAQEIFGLHDGPRPIYSFVSAFDVGRKSPDDWAALRALGLQRAYIGLETGDDQLLKFLNKPGTTEDAISAVRGLRAGGVSVGVIIMAGIGGDRFAESHVARSVETIEAMALDPADLVYLSNYVPAAGTEYPEQITEMSIRSLTDTEVAEQIKTLQAMIREVAPGVKVAPYRVEGFAL